MLIGVQTATLNAQVTFVNIAVAVSALAGGGKNDFAPSPDYVGVFVFFGLFLRVGGQGSRNYGDAILGRFGKFLATENRTKMRDLGCWSSENTAKTNVLGQLYAQKHVNYCVFEENIETIL